MTRVATYARVSTEEQAEGGFSLASQAERLRAYCEAKGWTIAREYVDGGYSGRTTKRPEYQKMLGERDEWDVLLVLKLDRVHRNSRNFLEMMDDLQKWGKDFASVTESFETTTAMGRFVMNVVQGIAQLESEQTGERVYWGMEQKAKQGLWPGGRAPYGYDIAEGRLVPNGKMAVVRRMRALKASGLDYAQIAKDLNQKSIPSPTNGKWTRQAVRRILLNPTYDGRATWGGLELAPTPRLEP